jgi:transcriptional regulator with XRE-family HTH domain
MRMDRRLKSAKSIEKSATSLAFGRALYSLRIEKNFSQEELSFRSEIDRSYLSQIERGEKEPCLGVIFKLSKALDSSPSAVFVAVERFLRDSKPQPASVRNARVR